MTNYPEIDELIVKYSGYSRQPALSTNSAVEDCQLIIRHWKADGTFEDEAIYTGKDFNSSKWQSKLKEAHND